MTSEPSPEPDPRRKRALYIGGAIALAAIAWNYDGFDDRDPVQITIEDSERREARDLIRREIRESVRAGIRGDREPDSDEEAADEEGDPDADPEAEDGEATEGEDAAAEGEDADTEAEEVVAERVDGDRRIVETRSGSNQRSFRIENDDGEGITISVDTGNEN